MICPDCGRERWFDLLDVWPEDESFQLVSCCEGYERQLFADLQHAMRLKPMERRQFLRPLLEVLDGYGLELRNLYERGVTLRWDPGLMLGPVGFREAAEFVGEHHRHAAPPIGWKWGHAVRAALFDQIELVGVAMVGRPVARALDDGQTVEVNRLCVDPRLGDLTWNAASMLYAAAARKARAEGYRRIVTYTLAEKEEGTSLKAAGWRPTRLSRGGSWDSEDRPRDDRHDTGPKQRWDRWLAKPTHGLPLFEETA